MKKVIISLAVICFLIPVMANAHGGGCRKDSPTGQCCHAGSKPQLPDMSTFVDTKFERKTLSF